MVFPHEKTDCSDAAVSDRPVAVAFWPLDSLGASGSLGSDFPCLDKDKQGATIGVPVFIYGITGKMGSILDMGGYIYICYYYYY